MVKRDKGTGWGSRGRENSDRGRAWFKGQDRGKGAKWERRRAGETRKVERGIGEGHD